MSFEPRKGKTQSNPVSLELSFVVCIRNANYPASLELRKIYQVLPDAQAAQHSLVRIVDESGEDYLYPADYFLAVELSPQAQQALTFTA